MTLHYWEKYNPAIGMRIPAYKCAWCGLAHPVPQIVISMKSIKPDDDNFDITCALTQNVDTGSRTWIELWECPINNEERKKLNESTENTENRIKELIQAGVYA